MKISLYRLNPTVGDLAANRQLVLDAAVDAAARGVDLVVTPELVLCGYPPRDLLEHEGFCASIADEAWQLAEQLGEQAPAQTVIVGSPWKPLIGAEGDICPSGFSTSSRPRNSLLVMQGGKIIARYDKRLLPTYDVFDEHRYFEAGSKPVVFDVAGIRVGLSICEDLWQAEDVKDVPLGRGASEAGGMIDPVADLAAMGATLVISPSASPFAMGKRHRQREILKRHCAEKGLTVAAVNQLGGNDDLIFDGYAACYAPDAEAEGGTKLLAWGEPFSADAIDVELTGASETWAQCAPDALHDVDVEVQNERQLESERNRALFKALTLGIHDYCGKTGFERVCLGLSGGIDSALTATLATAALGKECVFGASMPSRYSSEGSVGDADALAKNLGIEMLSVPIGTMHEGVENALGGVFDDVCSSFGVPREAGITEENVQSRLRGVVMMALSNKTGALLLTTGNKSELAVGYSTLYGDMNGGLAVLSDVTKVRVFKLAEWINANYAECGFDVAPIPEASITKPPSAELKPDQKDSDSLPPYEQLDEIVERYVEGKQSPSRIAAETGFDADLVARIVRQTDVNEYKRKQLAIGLKVTSVAFGRGRRRAIAQRYTQRSIEPVVRELAETGG